MNEKGWMMCDLLEEGRTEYLLQGELFDGTQFELKVPRTLAIKTDDGKRAWLEITWQGKEPDGNKVSITLPKPILNFGTRININENRLNKNIFVKPDIVKQQAVMPDKVLPTAFPQPFSPAKAKADTEADADKEVEVTQEEVAIQEKPPFTPAEARAERTASKEH